MSDLLKAAGITTLPPGVSEYDLEAKITRDNFVGLKVMELLIKRHAVEVLRGFRQIELDALHKRVGAIVLPAKPNVTWGIIEPAQDRDGQMYITASCGGESIRWNGGLEKLKVLNWRGSPVDPDIAELYRLHNSAPKLDPEAVAERRRIQRNEMALAQRDQNRPRSQEELEADRAFAKLPYVD